MSEGVVLELRARRELVNNIVPVGRRALRGGRGGSYGSEPGARGSGVEGLLGH